MKDDPKTDYERTITPDMAPMDAIKPLNFDVRN